MNSNHDEISSLLTKLTELGYRFTKKLNIRDSFSKPEKPSDTRRIIILDTETTGINPNSDKIIELGMVAIEYHPKLREVFKIETFDELEDPLFPIPPESTKVHGITDEMVAGKKISDDAVLSFIKGAPLIIAHNAKFDRVFIEKRFPFFENVAWGCSFTQIDWAAESIGSGKLDYIAYSFGFHFDGHRASNDCHALLEILLKELPVSKDMALRELIRNIRKNGIKISALNSRFEKKDTLKQRGYFWNAVSKVWANEVSEEELEDEIKWLRENIYDNSPFLVEQETITALNRFSTRKGETVRVSY